MHRFATCAERDAPQWCDAYRNAASTSERQARCYTCFSTNTKAIMLDPKILEDLSARISAALSATPAADIEKNLRAMLTAAFAKLDLVTREDFEVQKALLAKAQAQLVALEARLDEMDAQRKAPRS
jgi:ubiquinone biosynthesis accessory factor UbiK